MPQPVRGEHRDGHGERRRGNADEQAAREDDEPRLREVGVLAEGDLPPAQRDAERDHRPDFGALREPARVGDEDGEQEEGPAHCQRLAVEPDEAAGSHAAGARRARTAAARSRTSRSTAARPPEPSVSTSALPTTTPSASWAAACA